MSGLGGGNGIGGGNAADANSLQFYTMNKLREEVGAADAAGSHFGEDPTGRRHQVESNRVFSGNFSSNGYFPATNREPTQEGALGSGKGGLGRGPRGGARDGEEAASQVDGRGRVGHGRPDTAHWVSRLLPAPGREDPLWIHLRDRNPQLHRDLHPAQHHEQQPKHRPLLHHVHSGVLSPSHRDPRGDLRRLFSQNESRDSDGHLLQHVEHHHGVQVL
ncbi:hypothetical protein HWI79_3377 [Cryptosporidium felis]|nr:hypothetical protein HWI79_3377 [Cryptosporidium felis]